MNSAVTNLQSFEKLQLSLTRPLARVQRRENVNRLV